MVLELPPNQTRTQPPERDAASVEAFNAMREKSRAQSGERKHLPLATGAAGEKPGVTERAESVPIASAKAAPDQPVYFDPARGWYLKDGNNQTAPFNAGGKPYYDQGKGEWVKPLTGSDLAPSVPGSSPRPMFGGETTPGVHPDHKQERPPERAPINPPGGRPYHPPEQNRAIEITSAQEFRDKVLNAKGPVLVDFSMDGCGPCNIMKPRVDGLAREYSGRAAVYSVPHSPDWAQGYAPNGYPTIKVFNHGQVTSESLGITDTNVLRNSLNTQLSQIPRETQPPRTTMDRRPLPEETDFTPPGGRRPLAPFSISGFHSEAERDKFEKFAARKGFSPEAIERAETMTTEEWAAFNAINADRRANGRPILHFSPRVKLVSDYQADRQAAARQMTHGNPGERYDPRHPYHLDRLKMVDLGADGMHDGENAAYGTASGQDVTNMWLASPGHLRPIRDGFLRVGAVSCARSREGTPYWTFNASTGQEIKRI